VLVVTDSGVPKAYAATVAALCDSAVVVTVDEGESSKSICVWEKLLTKMLAEHFTRSDAVVAVGGGVVGDLAGFVAASYMRGVDFYNIPTTLLAQVDSSVGGKVAVDLCGIKNTVGAFYQPKKVLIDPEVLKTLSDRHVSNGLAEALKMSLTSDAELFELFRQGKAVIQHGLLFFEERPPHPSVFSQRLCLYRCQLDVRYQIVPILRVSNLGHFTAPFRL
jgi:3-dehydroquinate synthase